MHAKLVRSVPLFDDLDETMIKGLVCILEPQVRAPAFGPEGHGFWHGIDTELTELALSWPCAPPSAIDGHRRALAAADEALPR